MDLPSLRAFWPLLVIAFVGTMNPTSGDASVFLPLEQTVLTQTVEARQRTALFAHYSVIGSLAGAVGILAASLPDIFVDWTGTSRSAAIQYMFAVYALLGAVTFLLYRPLSASVEAARDEPTAPLQHSRRLVYGLAALFGMDSFGTGFLVQSLLALWLYQTFHVSVAAAAAILFWSSICSAVSYLVAVPIAERIGLINTMVYTHLPSNILLALVPFAPDLPTAIGLLLARSALSQMDVPTRTSYVMAVVRPEERPAAASVTAVPKTFAWAAGSLISGYLLTLSSFGWPLLIGGVIKGTYDVPAASAVPKSATAGGGEGALGAVNSRRHEGDGVVLEHCTGELPTIPRAGVDADAVRPDRRRGTGRVTMHDDDAEVLLARQETLADAKLVIFHLAGERHAWADAGVHEQVVAFAMVDRQRVPGMQCARPGSSRAIRRAALQPGRPNFPARPDRPCAASRSPLRRRPTMHRVPFVHDHRLD